eukprot:CAMPEP_0170527268 /NCGR_PEP_ID=MMETSP0209-20121228/12750_1 /TAXON_ID=665100 ORGANISM="Litonotus pictus, Strain P1" /NCGR_SAMPLE_ID=MMETSP0209 /ASSEMBLY_ACC=CAM_ASM_000301 /LENGTH=114 /DNA_ID=CAMNT_0010817689 /DNA_START=216 /DNA_END=556 /DNA_ORIENTATION=-
MKLYFHSDNLPQFSKLKIFNEYLNPKYYNMYYNSMQESFNGSVLFSSNKLLYDTARINKLVFNLEESLYDINDFTGKKIIDHSSVTATENYSYMYYVEELGFSENQISNTILKG